MAKFWNHPIGLMITAVVTLILVNVLKIDSISTAGSIGFLLIFGIVNFVCFKLSKEIGSTRLIPLAGFILCIAALIILINQQYMSNLIGILTAAGIIGFCFIIEWIYKKNEKVSEA